MFGYNSYEPTYFSPFADYRPYYASPYTRAHARALAEERSRERALAQARARAAQQLLRERYLLDYDEDRDSSDAESATGDFTPETYFPGFGSYGLSPRERAYLEAKYRQKKEKKAESLRRQAMEQDEEQDEEQKQTLLEAAKQHTELKSSPTERTIPVRSPSQEVRQTHLPSPPHSREPSPVHQSSAPSQQATSGTPPPSISLEEAASTIQRAYRSYRALRTVQSLQLQFEQLHSNFRRPDTLDFQGCNGDIVSINTNEQTYDLWKITPKLAYTTTNVSLHGYVESLNRLLVSLDAVESHGDNRIREKRKDVVKRVEKEAADIERWWRGIGEGVGEPNNEMDVCPEDETSSAPVPMHSTDNRVDAMDEAPTSAYPSAQVAEMDVDNTLDRPIANILPSNFASDLSEESEDAEVEGLVCPTPLELAADDLPSKESLGRSFS